MAIEKISQLVLNMEELTIEKISKDKINLLRKPLKKASDKELAEITRVLEQATAEQKIILSCELSEYVNLNEYKKHIDKLKSDIKRLRNTISKMPKGIIESILSNANKASSDRLLLNRSEEFITKLNAIYQATENSDEKLGLIKSKDNEYSYMIRRIAYGFENIFKGKYKVTSSKGTAFHDTIEFWFTYCLGEKKKPSRQIEIALNQ